MYVCICFVENLIKNVVLRVFMYVCMYEGTYFVENLIKNVVLRMFMHVCTHVFLARYLVFHLRA